MMREASSKASARLAPFRSGCIILREARMRHEGGAKPRGGWAPGTRVFKNTPAAGALLLGEALEPEWP